MPETLRHYPKKIENVLLLQLPGSEEKTVFPPMGLLAVSKILKEEGTHPIIFDCCLDGPDQLNKLTEKIKPELIGFGGIATSYSSARRLSCFLHARFPDAIYVAGGPLASTYDILLEDGIVDYVFHGEVEYSLPKFLRFIETGEGLENIGGISFSNKLSKGIIRMPAEKQVINLDDCGYPDYGLIDFNRYVLDLRDWYTFYKVSIDKNAALKAKITNLLNQGKYRYSEAIFTSRGCTNRCNFCYRHVNGIRRFSIPYVINNLKMLKRHCEIDGVCFGDELFNSDKNFIFKLCVALEAADLDLSFFMAAGMRADRIDQDMLKRMSEAGFISLEFGQESGSETILRYYGKGVSLQQNLDSVILTEKYAMHTCVQLVIGSPLETTETIKETVRFLKAVDAYQASINYILPLPETPLWREVINRGYIKDTRKYLEQVKKYGPSYHLRLNFSKANKLLWIYWYLLLEQTLFLNRHKHSFFKKIYYRTYFFKFVSMIRKIYRIILIKINKKSDSIKNRREIEGIYT